MFAILLHWLYFVLFILFCVTYLFSNVYYNWWATILEFQIQEALMKFPTVLLSLLDSCSVEPDSDVKRCDVFQPKEQFA